MGQMRDERDTHRRPMHPLSASASVTSSLRSLLALQAAVGNMTVARTVCAEGRLLGDHEAGLSIPTPVIHAEYSHVQRAWEKASWPIGGADGHFDKEPHAEDEFRLFEAAVAQIEGAVNEGLGSKKQVVLYIGVGTGNPVGAWGNPTVAADQASAVESLKITSAGQNHPEFLRQAIARGFVAVAANFNVGDPTVHKNLREDGIVDIVAGCRFPLASDARCKSTMERLHASARKANRVAVMNAVSDVDYQPLLDLAALKKMGMSSYLKSFMARDGKKQHQKPVAHSHFGDGWIHGGDFSKMEEVFKFDSMDAE